MSDKDIKKLWGLAAGICSAPACGMTCIQFLTGRDPTVIGEMAHVIAKKAAGPRGIPQGGADTYENTILLCPTCHTKIDKAPPGTYPPELLLKWKSDHEERVRQSLASIEIKTKDELFNKIRFLLIENRQVLKTYGPESDEAIRNPLSGTAKIWFLRKLAVIVPNNRRIENMLTRNQTLLTPDEYAIAREFIEHAHGFEENCYVRRDGIPKFPISFSKMVGSQ